jgi:hypothetical protein
MTFYPMECDPMFLKKRQQSHPKVRILHFDKTFASPVFQPSFIDRIYDIGGITGHVDLCILPSDGLKTFDYRQKFHPVIGRETESFRHLHLMGTTFEHHTISPGTRITAGCPVSIKKYRRSRLLT